VRRPAAPALLACGGASVRKAIKSGCQTWSGMKRVHCDRPSWPTS
jgi:hypothetical protein